MGKKTKIKDKDKLNFLTREAMIAMGGLGENKWDGLGQCLHTPTILQGDEQLNANCFHHHYHHQYCHDIIISVLSEFHYHSHRTRRKGGSGGAPMRALLVAPVTPSPRCCPGIVHWLCDLCSLGTLLSIFVHHQLDIVQEFCAVQFVYFRYIFVQHGVSWT